MDNCIFCNMAQDETIKKIKETKNFFSIRDKYPAAEGHSLVIPKKHFETLLDIPNELNKEMLTLTKEVATDLMDKKFGAGFNLLMNNFEPANQIVKHAHLHIIPRKDNDGIKILS